MPSDLPHARLRSREGTPTGSPDPLARLADVLAEASGGVRPTPLELAEVLWLARQMDPGDEQRRTPAARSAAPAPQAPPEQLGPRQGEPPAAPPTPDPTPAPPRKAPRTPLHLPSPAPSAPGAHASLLAPAPPMLRHPLGLQRALRPLKRRTDAPSGHHLDERATADRIARLGADPEFWLPVLRPARERWLRLNLVYDTGPTMPVWRPLIRALHTALAQAGVFRTVDLYRAAPDGTVRGPDAQAPADGRTITLLISDCMGPQWREGHAGTLWYDTLLRWARRMPLAVVQPLPEHLWRDTALPTTPGRLSAPHPVAATATLTFTPYGQQEQHHPGSYDATAPYEPTCRPGTDGTVPLPVLECEPQWLAHWAALLAAPGGTEFPAAVAGLGRPLPARADHRMDVGLLSAEELVLRFRASASPEAFRLAGHLAVGRPDLPVMRLLQAALEPDPRPQHLAEVILSGMLATVPGGPPGSYAFRDGVRDLLLLSLPRTARHRTTELLDRIGELIDRRAGRAPGEFRASTAAPSGTGTHVDGEAFATVSQDSLRRLSDSAGQAGRLPPLRERTLGFSLLGPLRVTRDGVPLVIDQPAEQALLCTLLLRQGEPATHEELATGLWGSLGRHGSRDLLDTYLDRLRHLLGPDTVTVEGGYALRLDRLSDSDDVDVFRVRRLAAEAERSRTAGDLARSGELAQEALELWRGEALAGIPGPAARGARDDLDTLRATLRSLRSGLDRASPQQRLRPTIAFLTPGLTGHPEARITLEYAVHELLSRGSLAPHQYETKVLPNGYHVHTEPDAYLLPVLVAILRGLRETLAGLANRPRLQVLLWEHPSVPADLPEPPGRPAADVTVVVSPTLYGEFTESSAAQRPQIFEPLYRGSDPDLAPIAWSCALAPSEQARAERELVQGPFITRDLHELGIPTPGRTAVVHTGPDGPLALLNPVQPYGTRPPRPQTYYSVDLTPHQALHTVSLPSSGKGAFTAAVELSWHVDDPVAFVRGGTTGVSGLLLEHLRDAAVRITRRHPLRRAGAAQRAVNEGVRTWPVPGLSVSYAVRLAPEGAPAPLPAQSAPSHGRLSAVLAGAETVLIGFDGPLARLFSAQTAREAALDLLSVVAEHRDPQDALGGRPPAPTGAAGREAFVHPLDLLRAFAHDPLGPLLRARLDDLELGAVPDAPTTHRSVAFVRALHGSGRRVSVVTDVSAQATRRYLEPYRLPLMGTHGRRDDLGLLMPHPDCLLRALDTPPAAAVLISSSIAELTAAQQLGLPFVGYAPTATGRRRLREEGSTVTVSSLEPLLDAARSL
ncbi:SAV_2336 N-terminal domain-related protein [Streptomyces sp. NPDC101151]|uniref:SAV_2336 N-terminal domain-related protein n=1 Tax=Streptomyces sp. NPDC101151 TaxID=3366115 RepID=UPI0038301595